MPRAFRSALLALTLAAALGGAAVAPGAALAHPSDGVADQDHDGVGDQPPFGNDNCAGEDGAFNPQQEDADRDGRGDACDTDDDGDTIDDAVDNCPLAFNQSQSDLDGDAIGDVCDNDDDGDGLADNRDNCRFINNPDQGDADRDGLGDACDESTPRAPRPPTTTPQPPTPPAGETPTQPGPPDTTAPDAGTTLGSRHRRDELGAGLAVPVTCSERCTVGSTLTVSARDARRLKLRGRTLGNGGAELDGAGETFVFVALPRTALRRMRGTVRAVLSIDVADAAGNRRTITRRITIRR